MFLNWTDPVISDWEHIHKYYRDEVPDGEETGRAIVRSIYLATRQLTEPSFTGRPGKIPGTKELIVKDTPYIVYYEVRGPRVDLLRIIHTSRLQQIEFCFSPK